MPRPPAPAYTPEEFSALSEKCRKICKKAPTVTLNGIKYFQCTWPKGDGICETKMRQRSNLHDHIKTHCKLLDRSCPYTVHHPDYGEVPCAFRTANAGSKSRHMREVHNYKPKERAPRGSVTKLVGSRSRRSPVEDRATKFGIHPYANADGPSSTLGVAKYPPTPFSDDPIPVPPDTQAMPAFHPFVNVDRFSSIENCAPKPSAEPMPEFSVALPYPHTNVDRFSSMENCTPTPFTAEPIPAAPPYPYVNVDRFSSPMESCPPKPFTAGPIIPASPAAPPYPYYTNVDRFSSPMENCAPTPFEPIQAQATMPAFSPGQAYSPEPASSLAYPGMGTGLGTSPTYPADYSLWPYFLPGYGTHRQ
ncbi:hypothetical protein K474DRAFT_122414 [Panus rudis PR-1116 ss-1]|nr:hypothetical protein K474DRAFT_122414 [Panus rudis PR-1116 ss-1]